MDILSGNFRCKIIFSCLEERDDGVDADADAGTGESMSHI